jgi:AcrR family transcriptional regulator
MNFSGTEKAKASLRKTTNTKRLGLTKKRNSLKNARRTQAERTALSDERMFEAAMQLIIEVGTHSTTLKAVGERAGYSRGLASNRFGSKHALFGQLVVRFNDEWAEELASKVGQQTGTQACLSALDAVEGFLLNHSEYMKAMYILWFESIGTDSEVRSHLADYHNIYRQDIAYWVREGIENGEIDHRVDPECFAFQFSSFIFGTIYQWLVAPEKVALDKQFKVYRESTESAFCKRD